MTTSHCPSPHPASSSGRQAALLGLATLASLMLAACGGHSDSPPPPPPPPVEVTEVPASAAASDAALEMFAIAQAPTETKEPLGLNLVMTLPSSETEDPIALP